MHKISSLLIILFFFGTFLFGQEPISEDYKVYSALINTEILDSTKSITLSKYGIKSKEALEGMGDIAEALKSERYKYDIYKDTEDKAKSKPTVIDSSVAKFIIDYGKDLTEGLILSNNFNEKYKVSLVNKYPIKSKSVEKDWELFYKKNPGSGGIFSLSKISYYSPDKSIAIFYYWHRRHGLWGHGAIAVMEKSNLSWSLKYKTYLWHN